MGLVAQGLHGSQPRITLTPDEREELEQDLISFCDRELDLLGDLSGLNVLYAGGSSPLWLEGLSQRVGRDGRMTALDADNEKIEAARETLAEAELASPVRLVAGDVFEPPFGAGTFDLVYSAGLLHELDVRERPAQDALAALSAVVKPGGLVATSDFVDSVPAVQLEDEAAQAEVSREARGLELYGVGPPGRLVELHEALLDNVRWRVMAPARIRHLDKAVLAEDEPRELSSLPEDVRRRLRDRRRSFLERVRREGYTRPATLYVEGRVTLA